jgi:hypothetical protein
VTSFVLISHLVMEYQSTIVVAFVNLFNSPGFVFGTVSKCKLIMTVSALSNPQVGALPKDRSSQEATKLPAVTQAP